MNNHWVDVSLYDTKNTDLRVANDNKTTDPNWNELSCAYIPDNHSNYNHSSPISLSTYLEIMHDKYESFMDSQEFRDLDFVERVEILEQITQFEEALEMGEEYDEVEENISLCLNFKR